MKLDENTQQVAVVAVVELLMNQRPFLFVIGIIVTFLLWYAASRVVPLEPPKRTRQPDLAEKSDHYQDSLFTTGEATGSSAKPLCD